MPDYTFNNKLLEQSLYQTKTLLDGPPQTGKQWQCAVLVPLVDEEFILLIKRTEKVPSHKGQYAFPGGHRLPHEKTAWEVATREFQEETDLLPVTQIGELPHVIAGRKLALAPVVAKLHLNRAQIAAKIKSNGEWDSAILLPITHCLQDNYWITAKRVETEEGVEHPIFFHVLNYLPLYPTTPAIPVGPNNSSNQNNHHLDLMWGATASILWTLKKCLAYKD